MKRSKNGPVAPSARNQLVAGAVTPADPWPAAKAWPGALMYIARSTMIGSGAVMTAETSVDASSRPLSVDRDGGARARRQRVRPLDGGLRRTGRR